MRRVRAPTTTLRPDPPAVGSLTGRRCTAPFGRRPRVTRPVTSLALTLTLALALSASTEAERQPPGTMSVGVDDLDRATHASPDIDGPWEQLSVMAVVDPLAYGAEGDGLADDTDELAATIESLPPSGGIVWLGTGHTFRITEVLRVTRDHAKLWSQNSSSGLFAATGDRPRRQALLIDGTTGVGVYGVSFRSDATRRRTALEDSGIAIVGASGTEVVGLDISGSAGPAIFVAGESELTYIAGNLIHDTWADSIHFTGGASRAWVWGNTLFTRPPRNGDDGIACVTYGEGPRCGRMEWWDNSYLGNGWGRGLAVVGGHSIEIHDNFVTDTAAAGILVASEPTYATPGSTGIAIHDNVVRRAGRVVPHPGILLSGRSGAIQDVSVTNNVVNDPATGERFRAEGTLERIEEEGTTSSMSGPLPSLRPPNTPAADTAVLATGDTSFVELPYRRGLHRIRVRPGVTSGQPFLQQLEYLIAGPASEIDSWLASLDVVNQVVLRVATEAAETLGGIPVNGQVVVVRVGEPVVLPATLRPVTFDDLRRQEYRSQLAVVWNQLHGMTP